MSLEKIKELRIKAESAKALLALADDETERKHFKKLLDKYKQELLKFLDEPQPKLSRVEPNEPRYITELKELCEKHKKYKVGDEIQELIKVVKNSNGDYELYYKRNNETLVARLTYEKAQKYLKAPKGD